MSNNTDILLLLLMLLPFGETSYERYETKRFHKGFISGRSSNGETQMKYSFNGFLSHK